MSVTTDLSALKARLEALSPADQLIIASELIRQGKSDLGMVIAENVVADYRVSMLRQRQEKS